MGKRPSVIEDFSYQSWYYNKYIAYVHLTAKSMATRHKNERVFMPAKATLHQVLSSIAFPPDSMHYSP
jgi:hypothetical protein